ncbi:glutamate-gated chloride channel alpha-like isoform X1 [Macrobrachium rosenbergii]|uniref:glutamate-gated chloride channel alpha-like isoform X1 n=2 Tax=Macrobrachium rosenbergii TaxID=79674 RepID=UPI0034D4B7CD
MKFYPSQDIPFDDLCRSVSHGTVTVLLPLLKFHEAVRVCRGVKGVVGVPGNTKDMQNEMEYFKHNKNCERQWAGITDEDLEGVWYEPFTGKSYNISEIFFRRNNPDGDKYQNCIRMNEKGLEDTDCQVRSCSACHTAAGTTWTLRGICEDEERMYYLDLIPDPLAFRGYGEYFIEQTNDSRWTWSNTVTNVTIATLHSKDLNYPIGRHTWEVQSDVCGQNNGLRELTLSACTKSEFTCTDGSCIPFIKRCDLKFDCEDKTDESFCQIVNFPEDYRSKLPPRPASNEALPLSINFTMDTLKLDTTTMLMSASYNLRITWFDNRLTYNNLKVLTRLNTLSLEQVDNLWRPKIGFINTDDIQNTAVDQDAVTTVLRHHSQYTPDLSNPYEVEIYRGDTNPISTTRKYFTIYTCNFDLVLYPFDIQNCVLQLQILSASTEYLVFDSTDSHVEYLGPKYLVEYGIGTINLRVENSTQYGMLKVEVELVRRYGYAMLNIYIPSFTLLTISYITLFFRPSIFDARVMTALTALLVLATLFTQVSASLPKTSYFKVVDIWLLFCILLIFVIILFHTVIDLKIEYPDGWAPSEDVIPNFRTTKDAGDGSSDGGKRRRGSPSLNNVVTTVKVNPVGGNGFFDEPKGKNRFDFFRFKLPDLRNDADTYILASKWIVTVIFLVFNSIYWGTLALGSGLVYYV